MSEENEVTVPVFGTVSMYKNTESGNLELSKNKDGSDTVISIIMTIRNILTEMLEGNISSNEALFNLIKKNKITIQDLFNFSCVYVHLFITNSNKDINDQSE